MLKVNAEKYNNLINAIIEEKAEIADFENEIGELKDLKANSYINSINFDKDALRDRLEEIVSTTAFTIGECGFDAKEIAYDLEAEEVEDADEFDRKNFYFEDADYLVAAIQEDADIRDYDYSYKHFCDKLAKLCNVEYFNCEEYGPELKDDEE